jgi:tripartite-type tricarboxylate transporter receptor subunit TctC
LTFPASRRTFISAAAALAASNSLSLRAQENKGPLRIIVPLPAGGVADASVRFFAEQWTAITKQAVVVDNKPGASFQIGMQALATSPADGSTWIHLSSSACAAQAALGRFDLTKQVIPIGMMGTTPGALFVPQNSPFQTAKELIDWIRANPGKLNYGTAGIGSMEHLSTAALLRRNGLTGTNVPFKGGPDSMTALAQNEIQMSISALPLIVPFKSKIRPLMVLTDQRAALTPNIPTYKEAGVEMPALNFWGAFAVPAGTPRATIDALHKPMKEALSVPALIAKYQAQGMFPNVTSSDAMAKLIEEEIRWMQPIASELNLKAG